MPSPRRTPAAAGSATGDKENICQDRDGVPDCPTLRREGAVSTKRKKKPGGFNLRKSIAWNPAFFTEEGVLDNVELSMLNGSQVKANGSPGSGLGGTISPFCRFGKSGNTSAFKEVVENSHGKLPAKFRSTENKGRQLFSSAKTSERDERKELAGTQDKRSARSIQKYIPRPPAGYAQKKVSNSIATDQVSRIPKKSQPSLPMVPRSTSSVSNISKPNKKLAPVKTEQTCRVEGLPLKSKIKPTSLTKSSGPNIEKDVVPAVTAIREEANCFGKCKTFSPSQNSPSSSVGIPASPCAKPSALRMPSPSVGFFAQKE